MFKLFITLALGIILYFQLPQEIRDSLADIAQKAYSYIEPCFDERAPEEISIDESSELDNKEYRQILKILENTAKIRKKLAPHTK